MRRGALTVEFALTLPLLFFLFFSAFEICSLNMLRHTAENAAYEGARRGAVPGATVNQVRTAAESILSATGTRGAAVTVSPTAITADTKQITVTVRVPLDTNGYVTSSLFKNRELTTSCTLTREQVD